MASLLESVKLQLQKDGKLITAADSPACVALCAVLEHQFYIRDRAHGDIHQRIDYIKTKLPGKDEA